MSECKALVPLYAPTRRIPDQQLVATVSLVGGIIDALLDNLDDAYLSLIDNLEAQTREAIRINQSLQITFKTPSRAQVLDWSPERAIYPHTAFLQLAEHLMHLTRRVLDPKGTKNYIPYHDLLDWEDEPRKEGRSTNDWFLARLEFARKRSIRGFFERVRLRFRPDALPAAAANQAAQDLIQSFGISQQNTTILPRRARKEYEAYSIHLHRGEEDLPYHLNQRHLNAILRSNNAISVMLSLTNLAVIAKVINESSESMLSTLSRRNNIYKPGDNFGFSNDVLIVLQPDHIEYRIYNETREVVSNTMTQQLPDVEVVRL